MKTKSSAEQSPKERLGTLMVGLLGNQLIVWGFDLVLYPYIIWLYGVLLGGSIMIILSFLFCYATIRFYDWAKKDWLGIETLKSLKEGEHSSGLGRLYSKLMRRGEMVVFFVLSIKFDPFITIVYMRKGAHAYNGLTVRDWKIFLASVLVGNIYWTIVALTGLSVFKWLWHCLQNVIIG